MLEGAQCLRDRPGMTGDDLSARIHLSNMHLPSTSCGLYSVMGIQNRSINKVAILLSTSPPISEGKAMRINDYKAARQGQSQRYATSEEVGRGRKERRVVHHCILRGPRGHTQSCIPHSCLQARSMLAYPNRRVRAWTLVQFSSHKSTQDQKKHK